MFADIKANSTLNTSFNYTNNQPATYEGSAEIKDKQLYWDDNYYFNVEVAKESRVLIINGESESQSMPKVFSIEPFYKLSSVSELSYTSDLAEQADLILVNGINDISSGLAADLVRLSEEGHSIGLFPGEKSILHHGITYCQSLNYLA